MTKNRNLRKPEEKKKFKYNRVIETKNRKH